MISIGFGKTEDFFYERVVLPSNRPRRDIYGLKKDQYNFEIDLFGKSVTNGYHSAFLLPDAMAKHVAATGSISKYCGGVAAAYLFWDIDNDESPELARLDALRILENIESSGADMNAVQIYYSGQKGFHITYRTDDILKLDVRKDMHILVKSICAEFASGASSFDESIYDKTRIIRAQNSIHAKTGLYKIRLDLEEVESLDIEGIRELAKSQREGIDVIADSGNEYVMDLIAAHNSTYKETTVDYTRKSKASELTDGLANGFSSGDRNNGLASLAGMYRRRNFDKDFILASLIGTNSLSSNPLPLNEVERIVDSVQKYSIDPKYDDSELQKYDNLSSQQEDNIVSRPEFVNSKDAIISYQEMRRKSTNITTPLVHMNPMLRTFDPTQVMMIGARPGLGKTLLAMKVGNGVAEAVDGSVLFLSFEMDRTQVGFRMSQCEFSNPDEELDNDQVVHHIMEDEEFVEKTAESWERFYTYDKILHSVEEIISVVNSYRKFLLDSGISKELCMVIIDYVQLMSRTGEAKENDQIAHGLKDIAKTLQCRTVVLSQINRQGGDEYTKPRLAQLKGMGGLEDVADIALMLWKDKAEKGRIHVEAEKYRGGCVGFHFDLIQKGLLYKTVDFSEAICASQSYELGR